MAKLSARGRRTQVEVSREYDADILQRATDKMNARTYPDGLFTDYNGQTGPLPESIRQSLTTWEKVTRRLMSDGTILECRTVRFRPDPYEPNGRRHNYGWKVHGKLKAGLTSADFIKAYQAPRKDGSPSLWTVMVGEAMHSLKPAKVISRARVMRAIQEDGSTGFCLACGAEAYGVEPDARGYRCEGCGQHEVYGAEEVLMSIA